MGVSKKWKIERDSEFCSRIYDETSTTVARVFMPEYETMITAAPEMYEALKAVTEFWRSGGLVDSFDDARDKVGAALAKAEGEG